MTFSLMRVGKVKRYKEEMINPQYGTEKGSMKILWFTWKDIKNPYAGGAEVVGHEIGKRLVRDGHEVVFFARGFEGAPEEEIIDGYKVIRVGGYHTVYWEAFKRYRKRRRGWADLVIEEVNTVPFFCNWYVREKSILFFHQLCRKIWFYEMPGWVGVFGYMAEPLYLFLLGTRRKIITVSESTKRDLRRYGFPRRKIHVVSEGISLDPISDLCEEKFPQPTVLALGSVRAMKRTDHIIKSFELAKKNIPDLNLIVAGCPVGYFGERVACLAQNSPYKKSIRFLGKVSRKEKRELMRKAHLICSSSVKEGWGLIVTEANSQGTPAVVYNVDGLRDSVKNHETGWVCDKNTPEGMSEKIFSALSDKEEYERRRRNAWEWSKNITFEKSYEDFKKIALCP